MEATEPLGVPVFPALPSGVSPNWLGFPETISLHVGTHFRIIEDTLGSLLTESLNRVVLVRGPGPDARASAAARE